MTNVCTAIQIAKDNGAIAYLILILVGVVWMWDRKCKQYRELKKQIQQDRKEEQDEG